MKSSLQNSEELFQQSRNYFSENVVPCRYSYSQWLCFTATEVTNRDVKNLLIKLLGENICFMYPTDRSKLQIFFSWPDTTQNLEEKMRSNNPVTVCTKLL